MIAPLDSRDSPVRCISRAITPRPARKNVSHRVILERRPFTAVIGPNTASTSQSGLKSSRFSLRCARLRVGDRAEHLALFLDQRTRSAMPGVDTQLANVVAQSHRQEHLFIC